MNVICGLPRSGSTLLCNILNQNPKFHASSTSPVLGVVTKSLNVLSASPDVKGDFARDSEATKNRIIRSLRAYCKEWYREHGDKTVFDKCRGWSLHPLELRELYPESKIIVLVRNLPDVLASLEKQHEKTSIFHENPDPLGRTIHARYEALFSKSGMIGKPLQGIQETILRKQVEVFYFKFEEFCADPKGVMNKLYCYLMEDEFEHDFENVVDVSTDPDALYFNKYPHNGDGKVEAPIGAATDYLHEDLVADIMNQNPWFHKIFGYGD